ncbi:GNAT family N-acetyltransferase [Rhizobacter sp. OV335]|uniref:GNAT family N-acetyltransferase n=1 Tax=Rhizobacter sp. OV335 TaxID=1500264 RepID=UPI0009193058|nr:GNAT family N-acetyltransferase [Rhizobacter sp. OV335]SHN02097.1 Protein N-acetyltransferase, RimJ/RimL family [Rhizobacter sp. OV335]
MSLHAAATLRGERVALRPWRDDDLAPFAEMNADAEVMRHFQAPLTREQSDALARRARLHVEQFGYGLWALEVPGRSFAGFVGLARVPFELPLPGFAKDPHEIGWRLTRAAWGRGFASEAARLALQHAWDALRLPHVVSFTAQANRASQAVMQRIGMTPRGEFEHPRIPQGQPLCPHVLYAIDAP